ncbi:MAG: hypothetical protein ACJA0K_000647 [Maricaulis maris]
MRLAVLAVIALSLALARVPARLEIEIALETSGYYAVTTPETGQLVTLAGHDDVDAGAVLTDFDFRLLQEQLAKRQADSEIATRSLDAERDGEPLRATTARQRLGALNDQIEHSEARLAAETLTAIAGGVVLPGTDRPSGAHLETGSVLGVLLPAEGEAMLSGHFPEDHVDYYREVVSGAQLRFAGRYYDMSDDDIILQERMSIDQQSGQRLYAHQVRAPLAPAALVGRTGRVRLDFSPENLWQRLVFHTRGLLLNLQDVRLPEVERQLGTQR